MNGQIVITSTELAALVAKSYDPIPAGLFDNIYKSSDLTICTKHVGDTLIIVCPGTENMRDVEIDLQSMCINLLNHRILGTVIESFFDGVPMAWEWLKPQLTDVPKVSFVGHSKGCAVAQDLGALMIYEFGSISSMDLLEPPRNHAEYLREYLEKNVGRLRYFRNWDGHFYGSPVTFLPEHDGLVQGGLIDLNYPPPGMDHFNCVKWHLMETLLPAVAAWELKQ